MIFVHLEGCEWGFQKNTENHFVILFQVPRLTSNLSVLLKIKYFNKLGCEKILLNASSVVSLVLLCRHEKCVGGGGRGSEIVAQPNPNKNLNYQATER